MSQNETPANVRETVLYAWVGEDELGSGKVGLKQHVMPCGLTPLVAVDEFKLDRDYVREAMQLQANVYGKPIRFCRFVFTEEIITVTPNPMKLNWQIIVGEVYAEMLVGMTADEAGAEAQRRYPDKELRLRPML